MGKRAEHRPGTFSWTDLSTTDQDAAKTFYAELLGWQIEDMPAGEGVSYSMASIGGQSVAAISAQPQQQRDAGVPPVWNSYITVPSVDDAARRAGDLGATVHAGPFDVLDAGRMAVVQDPQGAFFLLWEARQNIGARLVNASGALSWNELHTTDIHAAERFYGELLGWSFDTMESSPMPYRIIKRKDGGTNGGLTATMNEQEPPHWLVYFGCDELAGSAARAKELGGRVWAGPMDIGVGSIAVLSDPQGAAFALYSGHFDD